MSTTEGALGKKICWICAVIREDESECNHNAPGNKYASKKCWKCGITYDDDATTTCSTCWGPLWTPKEAMARAEDASVRPLGGWVCPNGHWVPNDSTYCPYCSSVRRSAAAAPAAGRNKMICSRCMAVYPDGTTGKCWTCNGTLIPWYEGATSPSAANGYRGKPMPLNQRHLDGCLFETRKAAAPTLTVPMGSAPDKADLRQYCSPVEDQGQSNSCTANACVGALEYHQRRMGGAFTDISRLFVYYNARKMSDTQGQDSGSFIHHVMASVLAHGACEEAIWPFDLGQVLQSPPQQAYQNAMSHEAVQYARAPLGQPVIQALAAGLPVVFGTYAPSRFYEEAGKTGIMPSPAERLEPPAGGHAMLIVGYDLPSKTWLIRNSWGPNWGEGGYFRAPFATLEAYSSPDHFWTIGAIESANGLSLSGMTSAAAAKATEAVAAAEAKEALAKLRTDLRSELQADLDAAKRDIKGRLRGD